MKITRDDFELIIDILQQVADEDAAYVEEYGLKRAGSLVSLAANERRLADLFANNPDTDVIQIGITEVPFIKPGGSILTED